MTRPMLAVLLVVAVCLWQCTFWLRAIRKRGKARWQRLAGALFFTLVFVLYLTLERQRVLDNFKRASGIVPVGDAIFTGIVFLWSLGVFILEVGVRWRSEP